MKKAAKVKQIAEVKPKLTPKEMEQLVKLEETIQEHSRKGFIEVGDALSVISEGELYKDVNKSFDSYCESRWGFSGSHARRLMDASRFVAKLRDKKVDDEYLPPTESMVRWFFEIREKKHRVTSWVSLVKAAKKVEKQLTTEFIREHLGDGASQKVQKPKVKKNDTTESRVQEKVLSLIKQKRDAIDEMSKSDWETFLDELESLLAAA